MAKKINMWAWISLALLLIGFILFPIILYQLPELFIFLILVSFGAAIKAIREIYKNGKRFKGLWLAITCLVFSSFVLIVLIMLYCMAIFFGSKLGEIQTNVSISSDEEAINYALELASDYGANSSEMSDFSVKKLSYDEIDTLFWINETDRQDMNISDVYNVKMKRKTDNAASECGATFSDNGLILEDFDCRLR